MLVYKKVDIFTPLELVRYLVNEGDLYFGPNKVLLSTDGEFNFSIHFSHEDINGGWLMVNGSKYFIEAYYFYKKLNWYGCIPEGKKVPCYVSDYDSTTVGAERHIHSYEEGDSHPYKSDEDDWKYATPIPADELWVPEL